MFFAQDRRMPVFCDKIAVRQFVKEQIGEAYLVPLISSGPIEIVIPTLSNRQGVLKCSHDSGSAMVIDSPTEGETAVIRRRFEALLSKKYGVGKGEWPYGLVPPQLMFEELLPGTQDGVSPPDVKVHCVDGEPRLYEVIVGRQRLPHGSLFLPNGHQLTEHLRDDRIPLEEFPILTAIRLAEAPARSLSSGLRYARVDFYLAEQNLYFGEITFFPESGLFSVEPGVDTSRLVGIPHDNPRESIYDSRNQRLL